MDAIRELNHRIALFGAGLLSKNEIEDWFFDLLWHGENSSAQSSQAALNRIEGILAEASHAHWSDDSLSKELATAIRPFAEKALPRPAA